MDFVAHVILAYATNAIAVNVQDMVGKHAGNLPNLLADASPRAKGEERLQANLKGAGGGKPSGKGGASQWKELPWNKW